MQQARTAVLGLLVIDAVPSDPRWLPGETARAVHMNALTAIFKVPSGRSRQSVRMLVTQVIGMWVAFWAEVIKPDQ